MTPIEIAIAVLISLVVVLIVLINSTKGAIKQLVKGVDRLEKSTDLVGVTGIKQGFPEHIEAAWEDVGAHGRFLTDLGGMSIKMREQLRHEVTKILYTPLTATPPAGSIADIMLDIDRELTRLEKTKDDVLVLVQTKSGVTQ